MLNVNMMRPSQPLSSMKQPVLSVSAEFCIDQPGCGFISLRTVAPMRISPVSAFTIFPLNVSAVHTAVCMRQSSMATKSFLITFSISWMFWVLFVQVSLSFCMEVLA